MPAASLSSLAATCERHEMDESEGSADFDNPLPVGKADFDERKNRFK